MNTSNLLSNNTTLLQAGPCVYCWCMLFMAYVPIVTLTVTVMVAVVATQAVPVTIRIVLTNILAASLATITGGVMQFLNRAILSSATNLMPSDAACRVYYWIITAGGTARLSFMATFAVVVFAIIKWSTTTVRPSFLLLSVTAIWMFVFIFNAQLFFSQIVVNNFLYNSGCVPHFAQYGSVYVVSFVIIFVLVPVTLTVLLPCSAIFFIRSRNDTGTMEGRPLLSKAMVKFTLFLLVGNTLGILGQGMPVLLATITRVNGNEFDDSIDMAINYTNGILLTLSFIPTPILILVCFKPVREQFRKLRVWLHRSCYQYKREQTNYISLHYYSVNNTQL